MRRASRGSRQVNPEFRSLVAADLDGLRAALPGTSAVLACTTDGVVIACGQDEPAAADPLVLAAAAADLAAQSRRTNAAVGDGPFVEALSRTTDGVVAVYAAGPHALLAVVPGAEPNVGLLHLHARRAAARIAELAHGERVGRAH
jgi:predicted regulator of Ras-like GTPase activity (Roadblock/LC7/MglB family)